MTLDLASLVAALEERLRAVSTPERAANEKRYLKSDLTFLGATLPQIQASVRDLLPRGAVLSHDELVRLVEMLWAPPVHERRMAAVLVVERDSGLLSPADLPLLERLLRESRTWALVDALAANVVGAIGQAHPTTTRPLLDRWATDDDFWIRRASLLAELRPLRGGEPMDAFLERADAMLDEKEFFIRKAIGWVLREAGKRRPAEVVAWLEPRTDRASGVTLREAIKHLPLADHDRLLASYRARRG